VIAAWRALPGWERRALLGALAVGLAIRVVYVLASGDVRLGGDEPYYHSAGVLAEHGKWFWGTAPYGIPHETLQKAPIYPAWVGVWYSLFGDDPDRVRLIQAVVSVTTIALGWLLARRLVGPKAAAVTAFVLAVYPNAWQFDVRLFSESLAAPLTMAVLLVVLTVRATPRSAALTGALIGINLLVRPSAVFLIAAAVVMWWVTCGLRRGTLLAALSVLVAVIVVAPWTIRNRVVDGEHLIPISTQDQAAFGTFNDDAAHDASLPYKWRPRPSRDADLFSATPPLSDGDLHTILVRRVRAYVREHPDAVPKALFWNGIVRLWDLRPPSQVTGDARFGHRNRTLTAIGLAMYWPLLLLALAGLVRLWRAGRRDIVLAVAALAAASSVIYIGDAGTRYRAPIEALIVVLACAAVWPAPRERAPASA
jgi:4-amino-4-deoxy-L-arabinose transferase-like glycosyltransferase